MLSGLCTYQDVIDRAKDVPALASGNSEESDHTEVAERKITQIHAELDLQMSSWIKERLDRLGYTNTDYIATGVLATPAAVLATLSASSETYMNRLAVTYAVYAMLEEAQTLHRFKHGEASAQITDAMILWGGSDGRGGLKGSEWKTVQPLLFFDLNGDASEDSLETLIRSTISSQRIYV
jgi:hypothetical protein